MTLQQRAALDRLIDRFNSTREYTSVLTNPSGLPQGWISAVVREPFGPEVGTQHVEDARIKLVAGIDPDGCVHS